MSRLFRGAQRLREVFGDRADRAINDGLYNVLYGLPAYHRCLFFNSGYLPLLPGLRLDPPFDGEPLQANFYEFVARTLPDDAGRAASSVLEIGCGRGGGLSYLAGLFPSAAITGIDANRLAVG